MSAENEFIACVEKLSSCVHEIKELTSKLESIATVAMRGAVFGLSENVVLLEKTLEDDIKVKTWDCYTCYHFDNKDGVCDMCAYGGHMAIDNNCLKPIEVQDCNAYVPIKNMPTF